MADDETPVQDLVTAIRTNPFFKVVASLTAAYFFLWRLAMIPEPTPNNIFISVCAGLAWTWYVCHRALARSKSHD